LATKNNLNPVDVSSKNELQDRCFLKRSKNVRFKKLLNTARKIRGGNIITLAVAAMKIIKNLETIGVVGGYLDYNIKDGRYEIWSNVYNCMPHNLRIKQMIELTIYSIQLDDCNERLDSLFKILQDKKIPFTTKEELVALLMDQMNFTTQKDKGHFILCIISMFLILYDLKFSSHLILMINFFKMLKEGKISKVLLRTILRKRRRKEIPVDINLLDLVEEETNFISLNSQLKSITKAFIG